MMTPQTAAHLDAWLDHACGQGDDRTRTMDVMLAFLVDYPELVEDRTWPEIRLLAERYAEWKQGAPVNQRMDGRPCAVMMVAHNGG